jgi:monoamine oxidase
MQEKMFRELNKDGDPEEKSCVIIGAGLSGLTAAYKLKQNGWKVILVEARDRIGGRVFTYQFRENRELYCELGGEWVGNNHKSIKKLCKKFRLKLIRHQFDYSFAESGVIADEFKVGEWPFEKRFRKKLKKAAMKVLKANGHADGKEEDQQGFDLQDWWTCLRDLGFSDRDLLRRDLMDSTDFGESIRQAGAFSAASEYYGEGTNSTDQMDWRILGGNTRLVNALAERIGLNAIHTSMEAKQVDQSDGWVTVHAEDARTILFEPPRPKSKAAKRRLPSRMNTFKARHGICTVPARFLNSIDWIPELKEAKRLAARDLQYARIMKTVLLFKNRFWEKTLGEKFSCFTDGTSDFVFAASLGQNSGGEGILCSYAIGDKADDLASRGTEDLGTLIAADLAKLFPGEDTKPIAVYRYAWQEDKYTQGAYAFYRPGQWFPIREALSEKHKSVYFAGEHIAEEQGFMDGAIDSGEEAADQVMEAFKEDRSGKRGSRTRKR